jgi:hypothetical protein
MPSVRGVGIGVGAGVVGTGVGAGVGGAGVGAGVGTGVGAGVGASCGHWPPLGLETSAADEKQLSSVSVHWPSLSSSEPGA